MATDVNLPSGYQLDSPGLPEGYTLDPETSVQGALGRGAVDAIPFGTKGAAALEAGVGEGKYKDYLAELDSLLAQDKQQHPIAHGTGEVAGSVAPFLIPGVGEALGAETLAGRAGIGAGIGALQAGGNTRADLTSPEGMKDVAMGAGTGAVLNPALGALGDAISGGASKLAPKLEEYANVKGVQAAGLNPKDLGVSSNEIQDIGNLRHELGADTGSAEEKADILKDALHQTGAQIGDLGEGKTLTDTQPFVDTLHNHLQESSAIYGNDSNPEATLYRQGIANLQRPEGLPFDDLQSLKNAAAERAFDAHGNIKDQAAFNVYKNYSDAMEHLASDHPDYPELKKTYSVLKDLSGAAEGQLGREQANGVQAKGFGLAGKMGAMVTGGNVPVTLGAAAALAPLHPFAAAGLATTITQNPGAMEAGARGLSGMLSNVGAKGLNPAVTNAVTNSLQAPKVPPQYAPVFQKATQGIQDPAERNKQMTITDFVLQSRDPNYSKAKQDMQENSNAF